jgi:hypothetical protein
MSVFIAESHFCAIMLNVVMPSVIMHVGVLLIIEGVPENVSLFKMPLKGITAPTFFEQNIFIKYCLKA